MDYVSLAIEMGIQGYVAGKEYRAQCPLHQDNNPSFSLNIETGLWHCFASCGSGDFIHLIERVLECSPQEAYDWIKSNGKGTSVEQLSKALAFELGQNPMEQAAVIQKKYWREIYELTTSAVMPMWFLRRGFTWKTINHWGIHYDNTKDAVIIPVFSNNEIIGTITRNTSKYLPKYQNSPGLPKSKFLFGEISEDSSEIIICEGILDALWLWQLDYNVVSLLGTHISQEQMDILRQHKFGEITLAFDNDEPGQAGMEEATGKLCKAGWLLPQIKIIEFPVDIKDPQDCDAELFERLYHSRRDVIHGI